MDLNKENHKMCEYPQLPSEEPQKPFHPYEVAMQKLTKALTDSGFSVTDRGSRSTTIGLKVAIIPQLDQTTADKPQANQQPMFPPRRRRTLAEVQAECLTSLTLLPDEVVNAAKQPETPQTATQPETQSKAGSAGVNYNTRTNDSSDIAWCHSKDLPVRVFEDFDGGGSLGYIVEFQTLEDLKVFVTERKISRRCWIEKTDGITEYLEL
ncbi:MAG: hypothetical protein WCG79_12365 [Verrucomicrobiota bacterium]